MIRSMLFVPSDQGRKVAKALASDADAVILDLEDAVAIARKEAARADVVAAVGQKGRMRVYVRVNGMHTAFALGDLLHVVVPGLDGILQPKVEAAWQVQAIDWLLGQVETERGIGPGTIDLIPTIETARGLDAIQAIAVAAPRVRRLAFGAGDFTLDAGLTWTKGEAEIGSTRDRIAVSSRAAGLEPPLDSVFPWLDEDEHMRRSAERARHGGFQGKLCIHPRQVAVVNEVFSPTAREIERARRIVDAFRPAEAAGVASIQVDGELVDYPVFERARRLISIASGGKHAGA